MDDSKYSPKDIFMKFDPSDRDDVLRHARLLIGKPLSEVAQLAGESSAEWDSRRSKGSAGKWIEKHFGLGTNNDAAPDLAASGIEIKSVPLVAAGTQLKAKERSVITMIDYHRVAVEPFEGTPLDTKTRLTLYVFYLWLPESAKAAERHRVNEVLLHDRTSLDLLAVKTAYSHVQKMSQNGQAHLLSEGDTSPVGACTKGAKGQRRTQPFSLEMARPRAFAWRPAHTTHLYRASVASRSHRGPDVASLSELINKIQARLNPLAGLTVKQLLDKFHVGIKPYAKNVTAVLFKTILEDTGENLKTALDALGITLKVARVNPDTLRPHEAVSFAPFNFADVIATPWDESDALATLGQILFIVLEAPRGFSVLEARLRSATLWSADRDAIATLKREYEQFRRAFNQLPANEWPRASSTEILHVRPHGRNAQDLVTLPNGSTHVRSSFWFNQNFVQEILKKASI